jgi:hypothetical protein
VVLPEVLGQAQGFSDDTDHTHARPPGDFPVGAVRASSVGDAGRRRRLDAETSGRRVRQEAPASFARPVPADETLSLLEQLRHRRIIAP